MYFIKIGNHYFGTTIQRIVKATIFFICWRRKSQLLILSNNRHLNSCSCFPTSYLTLSRGPMSHLVTILVFHYLCYLNGQEFPKHPFHCLLWTALVPFYPRTLWITLPEITHQTILKSFYHGVGKIA